jgi:hypothetical protein
VSINLHSGGELVPYEMLRQLTTPEPTTTHVPIPHHRVVDLAVHSLSFYGHEVVEQHHALDKDGMRYFGLLTLKSPYSDYTDTVGLRNSHDRTFPIGIGFGSRVFVCSNLAFSADIVIKRKHTANARRDLPGLIGELIEPLALARERQHKQLLTYQGTPLSDAQADHAIMNMFRRDVIGVQRIADVHEQWQCPAHDWGDKTAWRLFNAATFALSGKVAERPDLTKQLHQVIDATCEVLH